MAVVERLLAELVQHDMCCIVFCKTRKLCEQALGFNMVELAQSYHELEKCRKDILYVIKPTEDDRNKRLHAIQEIVNSVHLVGYLGDAAVKPFGSFVSNLYAKSGDLDVSVELPNKYGFPTSKETKQDVLNELMMALQIEGVARDVNFIPTARVPVLQYVSNHFGISCDISIDNYPGQIKSKVLYWINTIDERFGDMVLLFCHIGTYSSDHLISTYTGEMKRNLYWMARSYCLFVEDPFQRPENAARTVDMLELRRISRAFTRAKDMISSDRGSHRNELLSLLCTPEVGSKLGARATADRYTNPAMSPQQHRFTELMEYLTADLHRNRYDQRARGSTGSRPVRSGRQAAKPYQSQQLNCPQM
ncbi:hypothetical protein ACQ4PT_005956 [Festuca glaucescens]